MANSKGKKSSKNGLKNSDFIYMENLFHRDRFVRKNFLKLICQIYRDRKILKLTKMSFSTLNPAKSSPILTNWKLKYAQLFEQTLKKDCSL